MSSPQRAALLISGGVNNMLNYGRYANNLDHWARELQARGFGCTLCFADGFGLSAAGAHVRAATRSDIEVELSRISTFTDRDLVVVLVSNHGDKNGFCTWGTDRMTPSDLTAALKGCAATKILIFGQCFSGIFGSISLPNTVVVTACGPNEPSWACMSPPGPQAYDEFLFQLAGALFRPAAAGISELETLDSDLAETPVTIPTRSNPASVSLHHAFHLAAARDRRPETPTLTDPGGLAHKLLL